jgi:predicted dehydrogenase
MQNEKKTLAGDSRRDFIKKTATLGAALTATGIIKIPVYGQNQAPAPGKVIGANDRISVGFVGLGVGIGKAHLESILKNAGDNNVAVTAVCDLFNKRRAWAGEKASLKEDAIYSDYRKMLERKDVDAVVIATHDVWHKKISMDSVQADKHVYCEKPITRYLGEAFELYDTVKASGKIFQVGSQGCSAGGWHKAAELIKEGKIGQLVWSQGYYCRNSGPGSVNKGEWNYQIEQESLKTENIDFETWLGQVKNRVDYKNNPKLAADHFHRWRKYYPYCAGLLGDLAPHRLHPLMLASGNPEFPTRVTCVGSRNVHSDKYTPETPERDVPEHITLTAQFPSGYMLTVTCSTVNAKSPGFSIYGHKATLNLADQGQILEMLPEQPFTEDIDPMKLTGLQPEMIPVHEKNWFDSIRANKPPNANIDLAIRVQTVICLAEMAERMKMTCLFDEKTRKVTDYTGKEVPAITYGTLELS